MHDAYLSVVESLGHAALACGVALKIRWINAEELTDENIAEELAGVDGILVPGGFGYRAVEGKIRAAIYAMKTKVPYFGLCLGMQVACDRLCTSCFRLECQFIRVDEESSQPTPYP